MRKKLVPALALTLALACLAAPAAVRAAEKKDRTAIDMSEVREENEAPDSKHVAMGALGERVHGGPFGPWRCQVKLLDRRAMKAKMNPSEMHGQTPTSHLVSLSLMDPATGKAVPEGKGTVTVTGPGGKKSKAALVQVGGPFLADVDLPKAGEYEFRLEFSSGKRKASAKFSYAVN
jgi:hypothetical protein